MKLSVSFTFLTINTCVLAGSSFQASNSTTNSTINLSDSVNQSGRHATCLDEVVVYSCTSSTDSLTWNICRSGTDEYCFVPAVFIANDTHPLQWLDHQVVAILLNNASKNLTSQLIIPYLPSWNGTTVECMNTNDSRRLSYVIAGMPLSPILIWQNRSTLEHFLILQWSLTCDTDEDCSVIKIVINGTNPLNVSYPTNSAILDTSKYASEDLIEIAIYAINKCSIMSKPSARIVNIGNSTQDVASETCRDKVIYTAIGVGGLLLLLGLALGAIIVTCLCRRTKQTDQLSIILNKQSSNKLTIQ